MFIQTVTDRHASIGLRVSSSGAGEAVSQGTASPFSGQAPIDNEHGQSARYGRRRARVGPFGNSSSSDNPHILWLQNFSERRFRHTMIRDFISTLLARFQSSDEEGQTLVEYGLLLALIAIIVIVALLFLGPLVSDIFSNVGEQL
jgi:pilus assembly protein Flp/PilA